MRERILSEIRRVAQATGKVPGSRLFETETGILSREWQGKIWARWGEAVAEAGLQPNELKGRIDTSSLLNQLADCCNKIGCWPSNNDLRLYAYNNSGFPSDKTFRMHFPKRAMLIEALREWVLRPENRSYAEIAKMLPAPQPTSTEQLAQQNYGHVYLLRAGDYYKIGQSADLEKRVKSINVALPDKATLEHAISTDDPPGIEAYWHRRFADRRMNGEWFKLSKTDILAFKKRKFQ